MLPGQDRSAGLYSRAGLFAACSALEELNQHGRVLGVAHVLAAAVRGRLDAVEVLGARNRALCEQANAARVRGSLKGSRMVPQVVPGARCEERRITRSEAVGIGLVDRGQDDAHALADEYTPGGFVDQRRLGISLGTTEELIRQLVPGVPINEVRVPRAGIQIPQAGDGRCAMLKQHGLPIVARSMGPVVINRLVRLAILADLPALERSTEVRRPAPIHP